MADSTQSKQGGVQSSEGDPRPVFDGDWATASGVEKGAHSERVRQWKERHGLVGERSKAAKGEGAQGRMGAEDDQREADVRALQALIDAPKTLGSDRIRAIEAKQRILARVEEEQAEERYGSLLALRDALSAMPPEERVLALAHALVVVPVVPSAPAAPAPSG